MPRIYRIICVGLIIGCLFCLPAQAAGPAGADRIDQLANLDRRQLTRDNGPWPSFIFPISYWTGADRKEVPAEYFERYAGAEKIWMAAVKAQAAQYQSEYGADIRSRYDLFQNEQQALAAPEALSPPVTAFKTTRRLIDLAAVPATFLTAIAGAPIDGVRVLAFRQGRLRVIPSDIIEFTAGDRVVLPSGPESNAPDGDGQFDHHDKLFFMVMDAGHKIDKSYIRDRFEGADKIAEITLAYPADDEKAWVYVASFSKDAPARAKPAYKHYLPASNTLMSAELMGQPVFRDFDGTIRPTLAEHSWVVGPSVGGLPVDLYDRMYFGYHIDLRLFSDIDENVDTVNTAWRAWYTGDLVTYSRATWKVGTPLGIGAPTVMVDQLCAPFFANTMISISNRMDMSALVKSIDISSGDILRSDIGQYAGPFQLRYMDMLNGDGFALSDEKQVADAIDRPRDYSGAAWQMITGKAGSLLFRPYYDENLDASDKSVVFNKTRGGAQGYESSIHIQGAGPMNSEFALEWDVVPFFYDTISGRFNRDNLDLVLKRLDKPLQYRVGEEAYTPGRFFHVPDVQKCKASYHY